MTTILFKPAYQNRTDYRWKGGTPLWLAGMYAGLSPALEKYKSNRIVTMVANHGEIFHPHISTVTLYHVNPYPATGQFYKILLILFKILVIILLVYL